MRHTLFIAATGTGVFIAPRARSRTRRRLILFAVTSVAVIIVRPRGRHRENRAEYSSPNMREVVNCVCELLAFGPSEFGDDEHAIGFGCQNRGVGDGQQRGRIHDYVIEAPTQVAQYFLGRLRPDYLARVRRGSSRGEDGQSRETRLL